MPSISTWKIIASGAYMGCLTLNMVSVSNVHGPAHTAAHEAATGTRGASPGADARKQAGPREQDGEREGGLSAQVTDFARQLAELTATEVGGSGDREFDGADLEGDERSAPNLGQHTRQVLQELLGYSPDEVSVLAPDGVVVGTDDA